jgi:ribosome recycling factor
VNIVRKVIKETIENNKIETTAGREEVFSLVMKGFDSKFDEDGWQSYISDINTVSNPFVKEVRQLFKIEFENELSIHLTKNIL